MCYNAQKNQLKLCGMRLGKLRCVCKPNVSTAGHTSVFSRGTEHREFQRFCVRAFDTRKYIHDHEGRFSLALEHVFCSNVLFGAFIQKY